MKLHNYTLLYLSAALGVGLAVWAALFYFQMLDEIYDSIDDGLDNYKTLIIQKANADSSALHKTEFAESNYKFRPLNARPALLMRDEYKDTLMYMENEADYEPVRLLKTAFRTHDGRFYELQIISSMVEEDDLIEDLLYSIIALYLALLTTIFLVNNFLLHRIWKPFYLLLNRLKEFRLGAETPALTPVPTNVKEFQALDEASAQLLQRTLSAYNNQKQFIENAAHELQTPLALSVNKLELLAEDGGLSPEALPQIGAVIQTLERLTRLNKSLLILSRIENRQFLETQPVDFQALITRTLDDFAELAEYKNIQTEWTSQGSPTPLMDPALADALVVNLMKNALLHTPSGGRIGLRLTDVAFSIENTGLDPLDKDKIFGRFYKNSIRPDSTGLGLAIVKAVADLYGFRVGYQFTDRHIFTVFF